MLKIINKVFLYIKVLLLLIAFVLSLYIVINMYYNLEKNPFGEDLIDFIEVLLPFIFLLILFVINIVGKQKIVNDNVFYNLTCVLAITSIIYMGYRAMFDQNLVLWHKTDFHMAFEYFADQLFQIKAMLYGLGVANLFFIMEGMLSKKKVLEITD